MVFLYPLYGTHWDNKNLLNAPYQAALGIIGLFYAILRSWWWCKSCSKKTKTKFCWLSVAITNRDVADQQGAVICSLLVSSLGLRYLHRTSTRNPSRDARIFLLIKIADNSSPLVFHLVKLNQITSFGMHNLPWYYMGYLLSSTFT